MVATADLSAPLAVPKANPSARPRFRLDPAAHLAAFDGSIQQLWHPRAIAKVWHHRLFVCYRTHELADHNPLFAKHVLPGFDHTLTTGVTPKTIGNGQFALRSVPWPVPRNALPEIPVDDLAQRAARAVKIPFMDLVEAVALILVGPFVRDGRRMDQPLRSVLEPQHHHLRVVGLFLRLALWIGRTFHQGAQLSDHGLDFAIKPFSHVQEV